MSRKLKIASHVCRTLVGLIFVFSGFVKAVDPWGTALKVNEYLSIYGMEQLSGVSMVFSIWLCGAELMMGLMLLFKVRTRLVSIFALASMIFFTVLTFLSATWIPVEDCGCFGDALKLTPWETFAKNLVILPMVFVVWYRYRGCPVLEFKRLEIFLTVLFCVIAMGIGTYCYFTLPLIDFLPYKVPASHERRRIGWIRYVMFALSLAFVGALFLAHVEGMERIMFWAFVAGNAAYYALGAALAFALRDNRAFCKYICPVTVFLKPMSYFAVFRVQCDKDKCVSCGKCAQVCPMDVDVTDNSRRRKNGTECILCMECVRACPKKAL